MTNPNYLKNFFSESITFKLIVIFFLIILIQIPMSFVRGLIVERQQMKYMAENEISQRWGGENILGTPVLLFSTSGKHMITKSTDTSRQSKVIDLVTAKNTSINAELNVSERYLSIYEAAIYTAQLTLNGEFILPTDTLSEDTDKINLFVPLESVNNIKDIQKIVINDKEKKYSYYQSSLNNLKGFEITLDQDTIKETLTFTIELTLAGSKALNILPFSDKTTVAMHSNWESPSFTGHRLPDKRTINNKGFQAQWTINNIIKNIGQKSIPNQQALLIHGEDISFGVKVMIPANIYQVNERTVKYSFLIVLLTFSGLFLAELFFKLRLHPFQYLLIGVSLSVFYLLLLSVSEYLPFNQAYLMASFAVIAMISAYCSVVLKQKKRGIYTGIIFIILYLFIFILVKAEETSLLLGSISIWLILALVMYLTRKIDWYGIHSNPSDNNNLPPDTE